MAVAFGTVGTGLAYGSHVNSAVPVPASVAANDVILVYLYVDQSSPTVTAATGFTELTFSPALTTTSPLALHVYWKRASGADTGTYTFNHASATTEAVAVRYTGCATTGTPLEVLGSATRSTNSTTAPAVSGTTTQANEMVVYGQGNFAVGAFTPPTGFTERYDGASDLEVADKVQATAGATGSISGTSPNGSGVAAIIGLLAAASALTNTVAPAVTPGGTEPAGTVLATDNGTWSATPDSFTYQWDRDGVAISAATASSYTTTSTDIGHTITCSVTAVKAGFTSGTALSNGVSIIAAAGGGGGTVTPPLFVAAYNANAAPASVSPVTYSVTTAVGDTLVCVAFNGSASGVPSTPTGGTGLSWTQQAADNPTGGTTGIGPIIAWTATATAAETFTLSQTATGTPGTVWVSFTLRFSGAAGIGSTTHSDATGTAPQLTLVTGRDHSTVVIAIDDQDGVSGASRVWLTTAGAVTEDDFQSTASSMTGYGAHYADVGAAGSQTVGLTAPSTGFTWSAVALELQGILTGSQPARRNSTARMRASNW